MQLQMAHGRKKHKVLPLLIIGVALLVIGVASLFALQGKSIQFDRNFDTGGDLSSYIFGQTAGDGSRGAFQNIALALLRHRAVVMLLGVVLVAVFVALNRELLYSQKLAPYVFVAPFIIIFVVSFSHTVLNVRDSVLAVLRSAMNPVSPSIW